MWSRAAACAQATCWLCPAVPQPPCVPLSTTHTNQPGIALPGTQSATQYQREKRRLQERVSLTDLAGSQLSPGR